MKIPNDPNGTTRTVRLCADSSRRLRWLEFVAIIRRSHKERRETQRIYVRGWYDDGKGFTDVFREARYLNATHVQAGPTRIATGKK